MLNGIDVSSHQSGLDLRNISCDFVVIKATGGIGYVNPLCNAFVSEALESNKLIGLYHYAHEIGLQGSAIDEANYFVDNIKGYIGKALLVLDFESDNKLDVTWAKTWLDHVYKRTGIKPLLYTYTGVINAADFSSIYKSDYGLWIANYGSDQPQGFSQPSPPQSNGFPSTVMYQYTSNGFLSGWNKRLDLNVFYGTKETWNAYATASKPHEAISQVKGGFGMFTYKFKDDPKIYGVWGNKRFYIGTPTMWTHFKNLVKEQTGKECIHHVITGGEKDELYKTILLFTTT